MNPEGQMRLSDSVKLFGVCTDMCPEYERVRRIVEMDVKPPECVSRPSRGAVLLLTVRPDRRNPTSPAKAAHTRRSAHGQGIRAIGCRYGRRAGLGDSLAGHLPGKQRLVQRLGMTRLTWQKTLDYLMQRLDHDEFGFLHSWIWDRSRAIRKDLRTQRIEQRSDITILLVTLERSARFLLLSSHQMARSKKEDYSYQQDIEQLNQTLISLNERYVDNRRVGYPSDCEAEFYAYHIILAPLFAKTQTEDELHRIPSDLRNNPRVQTAIQIYTLLKSMIYMKPATVNQTQANWKAFWDLIKSPAVSYLMACAAEVSFQRARHVVLDALWRTFRIGSSKKHEVVETWTTDRVQAALGFDTPGEAVQLCEAFGFRFGQRADGHTYLDVSARGFVRQPIGLPADLKPQMFSQRIVEAKRYGRAFSAIVQAMSVQQAKNHGLMVDSVQDGMQDETSLFVPEAPVAKPANPFNGFARPNDNANSAANPFLPKTTTVPAAATNPFLPATKQAASAVAKSNPFLSATAPSAAPSAKSNPFLPATTTPTGPAAAKPNPFLPASAPSTTPLSATSNPFVPTKATSTSGFAAGGSRPGLFDATKNSITFGDSGTASPSSNGLDKANAFAPKLTAASTGVDATKPNGTTPQFDFAAAATATTPQQSAASDTSTTPTGSFAFPGFAVGGVKSFTPTGSPAPAALTGQDSEKQKAEDEALRRKAEADAEAQRQRALEEQKRLAKEQIERQRIAAAQHQQRLQEEERNRIIQAARDEEARIEQARIARLKSRESTLDALAADIMFDAEEGLMMQYVENLIFNLANDAIAAREEEDRKMLREKQEALANAMYEQRISGFKRLVMASWITKVEKKKKARQAKERRKRLREKKAKMVMADNVRVDMPTPTESEAAAEQLENTASFRKPAAPASSRREKRTEERRGTPKPRHNGNLDTLQSSGHAGHTMLTPVSMNGSHTSSAGYSEAYHQSNAPIDRTESEYWNLRAQGYDPKTIRKRTHDESSDEEQPDIESKRPKMSPPAAGHTLRPSSRAAELQAQLDAMTRRSRSSAGSPTGASSFNGRTSLNGSTSLIIEQARQMIDKSRTVRGSPPNLQHDWGHSVPNLGHRASSSYQSVLGRSAGAAPKQDQAAYRFRDSRFVDRSCYGGGAEAVIKYRRKHGLSVGTITRPTKVDHPAASSPIPVQQSYLPPDGYTQEQYSENDGSSVVDIVDIDVDVDEEEEEEEEAEDDTTQHHYEADTESESEPLHRMHHRPDSPNQHHDTDADSSMENSESGSSLLDEDADGQYADEVLESFECSTESESNSDVDGGSQAQKTAGTTEDDAIELSD
jgi:hypothetical protein